MGDLETIIDQGKQDEPQDKPVDQVSETEQKALGMGWKPKADFDGPEEEFISAREFVKNGELIGEIKNLKGELRNQGQVFETRLQNVNILHEQQLNNQLTKLQGEQRQAAEAADMTKFDAIGKQIDDVQKQGQQLRQPASTADPLGSQPEMQQWRANNPWIKDGSSPAKALYAENIAGNFIQSNPQATVAQMLGHIDREVSREFPQVKNENRDQPSMADKGKPVNTQTKRGLSMNDLTAQERNIWKDMGSAWKDEKTFLKACEDARKG